MVCDRRPNSCARPTSENCDLRLLAQGKGGSRLKRQLLCSEGRLLAQGAPIASGMSIFAIQRRLVLKRHPPAQVGASRLRATPGSGAAPLASASFFAQEAPFGSGGASHLSKAPLGSGGTYWFRGRLSAQQKRPSAQQVAMLCLHAFVLIVKN